MRKTKKVTETIPSGTIVYHGTAWSCDDNFTKPFRKIQPSGQTGVAWVTDQRKIADGFAKNMLFESRGSPTAKKVVLNGVVKRDLRLLDLDYSELCIDVDKLTVSDEEELAEMGVDVVDGEVCLHPSQFVENDIVEDFNELYGFINDKEFDGAYKADSDYQGRPYSDYALFRPDEDVSVKSARIDGEDVGIDDAINAFNLGCAKGPKGPKSG